MESFADFGSQFGKISRSTINTISQG